MLKTTPNEQLRNLLLVDAGTCVAMGALLIAGSALLADLMALPTALLHYAGIVLIPIAAFMAVVALWVAHSRPAVWLIIAGNGLWVVGSALVLAGPWVAPNLLGYAFIGAQALVVALLMTLEHKALYRMGAASPA